MEWHAIKEGELLKQLKSNQEGLNEEEVARRLKIYGRNELKKVRRSNALKILLGQFTSFLVIILIIAIIISVFLKHWIDFSVILGIVILNGFFGFFQEYKAEKEIENLKKMLVPKTKVMRKNKVEEIDARDVVPGDILVLSEGDEIPADARILQCSNLEVHEAAFTGESLPVEKFAKILRIDVPLTERINMLYQGTGIVKGSCQAVVVSTGMKTELGKIAELVQEVKPEKNPFKEKMDKFAKNLGLVIIGLIMIISLIGLALGLDKLQVFFTAVSLAVSAIPEGLPAVVTITLALATKKMAKVNVLIRKLPAAETLGRVTVIATDKTGTITEEKMSVKKIYVNRRISGKFEKNKETSLLFKIGILCNNARIEEEIKEDEKIEEYVIGDPTEKALLLAADEYGIDKKKETKEKPRVREFPFASDRKMMSIVRETKNGYVSYAKGAPEVIIEKCSAELINNKIYELKKVRKEELLEEYKEMALEGMRVLAFAYKPIIKSAKDIEQRLAEHNLIFVGFQGFIDPPRKEVKEAIKQCKEAGIKVIMLTGDSALTAKTIGEEIGLEGEIIEAEQLERISDEKLFDDLDKISIFARVSPEDKLRIINVLKRKNEIVAFTGDGVNDAPALKRADIGIAVGRGTDVAKDASDMILVDNHFASIVNVIKEGRRVDDNINKFIKYMFSANFYEIMLVFFAILASLPLPLLPLQILWLNFITDSFPALALSTEHAEEDIMKRKPKDGIFKGILTFSIIAGVLVFLASFLLFYFYVEDISKARTMAATTGFVFEMLFVFNCKSKGSVFKSKFNKYIIYAISASLVLHLLVLYTPLNVLFSFVSLGIFDWLKILALSGICFLLLEAIKVKMK